MDAARLLPVAGALLFALPLIWSDAGTATGGLYVFGAWGALILAAFVLSRRLIAPAERDDNKDAQGKDR